ncbi:MAG TPA: PAS domain S-box protein [Burkholderiales bacterium]|nr:PAS domain S-box protein [Burkholderiales bacterium]
MMPWAFAALGLLLAAALVFALRSARATRVERARWIEQQQRADLLVRATQAGLFEWEANANRTSYSERLKEMLGYPADVDTSKWPLFFEFIHPEDRERVRGLLLSQLRDRSTPGATRLHEPSDYRVQKADGSYLWVQAEAISLTGEDGRTLRYICSFIDISQRKRQEIELSDRVKFIRDMFDSVPIALALRDASGRYLFVNRTWERYVGAQRDEVVGARVQDQFAPGEADSMLELDRAALERGPDAPVEPQDFTHRGRRYLQTRTVMSDARGRPIGVLIASLDTTERHAMEQQLADRAKFVAELVDALPISVALRDPDGRYALVNRAWESYFGVRREDALGKRRRELPGWKGDPRRLADADEIERLDADTLARGPDFVAEPQETLRLGRHYLITRRALFASGGKPIGVLSAGVDMTERREQDEKLRNQFKFVNDLVESVPVAVAMRDTEGKYLLVNRTWEQYFGARRDDVLGRSVRERAGERMASALLALDRAVLERGAGAMQQEEDFEYRGRRYTQTRSVMADAHGKVLGVLIASIDTTERYSMELALRESELRYDVAMRAVNEGVYDWNVAEGTIYYADSVFRSLGMPESLKTVDDWRERIHPDDRARYDAGIAAHFKGATERFECDYRYRAADDSWRWARQHGLAQRNEKGRAVRMIGATGDITELKEAELALARERQRLSLLLRATKAGFMDWDARTDTQVFSGRFREMLGHPADADTSKWPSLFEMMHPDDREPMRDAFRSMLHRVATTGERLHGPLEYRLRKADGSYLWVRGEGIAQVGEDGRTARFLTSYIDITHLREMNLALEESVRLREEVDRMSRHDLKTPLNAIIGLSRLLREEVELGPEDADVVARIEQAGLRLLGMINLSLNMFRMEQGTYPFAPKTVSLREVLDQVARDLRAHAAAKKVSVTIDGENCIAWGEELLCYSLFGNLVKNAIEASPEAGVVGVSLAKTDGEILVRVHNAGAVPEAIRGRFFEKYSTAGKSGGTGLGTYSARLMARVQLGDIEMHTGTEAGTTLSVRLAAVPEAEAAVRAPAPAAPVLSVPRSILVVDDDDFSRLVVQRCLPASSKVTVASNGRDALEAARAAPFDAIVMDLDMPVMGGLEAVARIREMERESGRRRCTIIAASSHDDEATRLRSLKAGFDAYLEKPVSPDALRRLLGDLFLASEPVEVDPDLRKLMPEFLRSRRALAAELADAVDRGEAETARAIAHKLAGSFLPYGFHWAARHGKMIEQRARDRALDGLAAEVRALREHLDTVELRDRLAEAKQ